MIAPTVQGNPSAKAHLQLTLSPHVEQLPALSTTGGFRNVCPLGSLHHQVLHLTLTMRTTLHLS